MGAAGSRRTVGFPVPAMSFVGRRHELAQARRLLTTTRLLTLTGPGGVGKTRLAGRVAEGAVRGFPDGVRSAPLAAVRDGALVALAVADALGIRDETGRAPLESVVEHLRGRRLLLVLDNCEHVSDACAALVAAVLAGTEGVRVLATSRHRLGLAGEQLLPVAPLATPTPGDALQGAEFPALRLFADRAAAVAPGFGITDHNRAAVARLCHRLDGLPLAIELAAVRMHALGVEQLDERLGERFGDPYRLLTSGSPAAPPRHQTLRSAMDWSHDLCTPDEQLTWARLSVFTGSFDLAAAEAVCAEAGVLEAVGGLVEKSVLVREDGEGKGDGNRGARYRMLTLLREYGLEKLEALGAAGETRRRLCGHFVRLAQEHERNWFGPDQPGTLAGLRAEHDNLRAVLDFCLTTPGESPRGLRLVGSLWFYWIARGAWAELRHWWQRLARREGDRPSPELARAHWAAALIPLVRSRISAVLLAGAPNPPTLAAHEIPDVLPLADVLGDDEGRLLAFHILSRVEMAATLTFHGRPERAVPLCADALAVCEAYGEQWVRSYVLAALTTARWALGEHEAAIESARRCLRLPYVTGQPHAVGGILELLAVVTAARGDAERATVLRGAAHRIRYDLGHAPPAGQPRADHLPPAERQAREALGDGGYAEAHRRGYELSAREALAYALGDRTRPCPGPRASARAGRAARPASAVPDTGLTRRELEVAGLIASGLTNRQIAERLVISRRTAEGHAQRILAKLGFAARSQVAAWFSGLSR